MLAILHNYKFIESITSEVNLGTIPSMFGTALLSGMLFAFPIMNFRTLIGILLS